MPANAGIQVRFRFKFQNRLDSGWESILSTVEGPE
jgi:hypothetical protein